MRTKLKWRHLSVLAGSLVATGCGLTYQYYTGSTDPVTATIEISMSEVPFEFWMFENGAECKQLIAFSKSKIAEFVEGNAKPMTFLAGREIAVFADGRNKVPLAYCDLTVSFTLQPGSQYRLRYAKEGPQCSLALVRVVVDGTTTKEISEPLRRRTRLCLPR